MKIATFNKRVTFYDVESAENEYLGYEVKERKRYTLWARVWKPRYQEGLMHGASMMHLSLRLDVRGRRTDITRGMRVDIDGIRYEVEHVDLLDPRITTLLVQGVEVGR